MEKILHNRAGQSSTIWRMRIACWIPKDIHTDTHTHPEYVILTTFSLQHCCTNAPHCYVYVHCLSCFHTTV